MYELVRFSIHGLSGFDTMIKCCFWRKITCWNRINQIKVAYVITVWKDILIIVMASFIINAQAQKDFNDSISRSRNVLTKKCHDCIGQLVRCKYCQRFYNSREHKRRGEVFLEDECIFGILSPGSRRIWISAFAKRWRCIMGLRKISRPSILLKNYTCSMQSRPRVYRRCFYLRKEEKRKWFKKTGSVPRIWIEYSCAGRVFLILMDCVMYVLHHKNTTGWIINCSVGKSLRHREDWN